MMEKMSSAKMREYFDGIPFTDLIPRNEQVTRREVALECLSAFLCEDVMPDDEMLGNIVLFVRGEIDIDELAPGDGWKLFVPDLAHEAMRCNP